MDWEEVIQKEFPLEYYTHILQNSANKLMSLFSSGDISLSFKSPLDYILKPVTNLIMNLFNNNPMIILLVAGLFLFFSLRYFVKVMKPLVETEFKRVINEKVFKNPFRSFVFGIVITVVVQSSSVTTSLAVPLAGVGIITLHKMFPYILGANVGTTFTSLIAASVTGSPAAITIALVHLLFNLYGIVLVYPIRKIPLMLSEKIAKISAEWKIVPFIYIGLIFYVIPLSVIIIGTI